MMQKMFLFEQQIVMLFADGIDAAASREEIAFEKRSESFDRALGILNRCPQGTDVPHCCLNSRMAWQAIEETNSTFGRFDGHLGPKARRICFSAAEIGNALLD